MLIWSQRTRDVRARDRRESARGTMRAWAGKSVVLIKN